MYMTALIRSSDVKKIEPIMVYEGINTISVHAVHAGTESISYGELQYKLMKIVSTYYFSGS